MSDTYDIAIIGAGPVGLMLSTLLTRWGYQVFHIDNRPTPTPTGRADGIQPRSLELLKNMGLKNAIMAYKPALVYEVAFWESGDAANGAIERTGTHASCPEFIDTKYPFTTLLHQGMIERVFIDDMAKYGAEVQRPWEIIDFEVGQEALSHPVAVTVRKVIDGGQTGVGKPGEVKTIRAKYLFGGEGGRSFVRQKLGIPLKYKDPTEYVWAVMDGVVKTTFPDIKMKCTIRSSHGSIMVIPREDNMVRLYIQLLADPATSSSPASSNYNPNSNLRNTPAHEVQAAAKRVLAPYTIEWERVEWFSVYPIGQGIAEKYAGHDERVFVGGDATHTHSPKAGQGMNTAFLDAQNLAWKIHYVESGVASRSILKTYETERKLIAERLLDFDSKYAKLFSGGGKQSAEVHKSAIEATEGKKKSTDEFLETFKQACEFTSGYGVSYPPNVFNVTKSPLSIPSFKLIPGKMLKPATVTRVVDANVVQLEQQIPSNGAWRIYLFAGQPSTTRPALQKFSDYLLSPSSFYTRFSSKISQSEFKHTTPDNIHTPDSPFFSVATVYAAHRPEIEISTCPEIVQRYRELVFADDRKDYVWSPGAKAAIHSKYGIDEVNGGVVIVRPDGYVGVAFKLESSTGEEVERYFARFLANGNVQKVDDSPEQKVLGKL